MAMNKGQHRLSDMIFARSSMRYEMPNLFRQNIDVWVLGTTAAYRSFRKRLDAHASGRTRHTQLLSENDKAGMDVLLFPTCLDAAKPFLLIQERIVHRAGRFNMELMIGGCCKGFAFLRDEFSKLIHRNLNDSDDHEHVDEDVSLLVLPSVFLNIRGPVKTWNKHALGETHWEIFVIKNDGRLPDGISHLSPETWDYGLLKYDDLYARIPRRARRRLRKSEIRNQKS